MNDYTGKICPYCKTAFRPDDDIIVCSECDMPHHKDCWVENQGCTTFGCLGTIKAADNANSTVTATQMNYDEPRSFSASTNSSVVFCTRCGTQNSSSSSFCSKCGSRLASAPATTPRPPVYTQADPNNHNPYSYTNQQASSYQSSQNHGYQQQQAPSYQTNQSYGGGYNQYQSYQNSNIDSDVVQLIQEKSEYYVPRFQKMKATGSSSSWNWPAFLVAPYWMIYRKMYGYGAAVLAADIFISLFGVSMFGMPLTLILILGGYSVFGILGNSIYMKHLESKSLQAKSMSEPYKSEFINSNGGVNTSATVLSLIGRVILVSILLR